MVLPDGKNRWYLEATRRDGEKVALHVNLRVNGFRKSATNC
jgi:hypothetical protein